MRQCRLAELREHANRHLSGREDPVNSSPIRPASHYVGRWLRTESHIDLGFGFCKAKQGDMLVFSYVDVPDTAEHEFLIRPQDVIERPIPEGTRVWLRGMPYGWQPGEIRRALTGNRYEVSLVGHAKRLTVHPDNFKVRWSRPLYTPAEAIAVGLAEAPTFYEARSALLEEFIRQRQVCRGLTAAISAPIELFEHQIDTAARVLGDPVMRYLLADEVGLGKTIEAGIIIRQYLADDPTSRVLVLCPETLVGQWVSELCERMGLQEAIQSARLKITSDAVLLSGRARPAHWIASYDLIVIDEAHNAVSRIEPHSEVADLLRRADGLLALSATPMRGDLKTFQRLLALVDPVAFGDSTPESFAAQIQERERSARDVQLLSARRASLRQKTAVLDSLEAEFSGDRTVSNMVAACRASEDPHGAEWTELADYIREICRLSRRLIRHRRNSDITDAYSVAGRVPTLIEVDDPARPIIDAFLESYRRNLIESDSKYVFAMSVLHALGGPVALREFLRRPSTPDERALFEMTIAQIELAGIESRLTTAASVLADRVEQGQLVVAASGFPAVIEHFSRLIEDARFSNRVYRHLHSMTPEARNEAVAEFLGEYEGGVLLADSSIDEGRNLQEAQVLINLDIPLDINQLEQRIGRLDRYAVRSEPAEVVVFTESASDWVSAHINLLREGIGVFDESVSTVQRLLTDVLGVLLDNLLPKGVDTFDMDLQELRGNLEEERDNIDLLEELESVESTSDSSPETFDRLLEYESDVSGLRDAVIRLTTGTGSLALKPRESPDGVVNFGGARGIGLSAEEALELERLLQPKAYERSATLANSGVMPFRIGDPLVDWLEEYLKVDERGRASAIARPVPGLGHPSLWLHCEFLVEFDSDHAVVPDEAGRRRLSRRSEAHLQPLRLETWTDPSGPAPPDLIEETLSRPFDPKNDVVLRGPVWEHILEELPGWRQLCLSSSETAWAELSVSEDLSNVISLASESAEQDAARRLAILRARALRTSGATRQPIEEELELERRMAEAVLGGIRKPEIRMVACGVCVLWPEERF